MCKLYKLLGIKLALLTAYHPQTNGVTTRLVVALKKYFEAGLINGILEEKGSN
jgi:hypothetical protein